MTDVARVKLTITEERDQRLEALQNEEDMDEDEDEYA